MDEKNSRADRELEHKPATKGLPEYLKQKLRARGILKDDSAKANSVRPDDESLILLIQLSLSLSLSISLACSNFVVYFFLSLFHGVFRNYHASCWKREKISYQKTTNS